ncbi:MAG: peptidoglycan editing factor PgeF [Candidatus Aminicenantia bacterium]
MKIGKKILLGVPYVYLEGLEIEGVIYGFTTKEVRKDEVISNLGENGSKLITIKQIHSSKVLRIGRDMENLPTGDGLITNEIELFVGIKTADCLSILIVDEKKRAVGALHAGWRGTLKEIVKEGIKRMSEEFGSNPSDLIAILGPSISICCYEIGEDVEKILKNSFSEFLEYRNNKVFFNLREANKNLLLESGVREEKIFDVSLCTKCEGDLFFSHRRGESDRNISFIGIQKNHKK